MTHRPNPVAAALAAVAVTFGLLGAVAGIAADAQPQAMKIAQRIDPSLGKTRLANAAAASAPRAMPVAE